MSTAPTSVSELTGTWNIDPTHSEIGFVARHAMVTKVRGTFDEIEGSAVVGSDLADTTATVTIQAASINTRNEQRDGHLKSNDFLAIDEYPTITFSSTGVSAISDNELELTGDLTIRGVTQSVTIPFEFGGAAVDAYGNLRAGFEGEVVINRKDFGVNWNAALEAGGLLVSDKVTLVFEISAIKAA